MLNKIAPRLLVLVLLLTGTSLRSPAQTAPRGPNAYDLSIALDASPDPAAAGGEVTVVLTATNEGESSVAPVTIQIATPDGTTFASASGGVVEAPQPGGTGTVTFTFPDGVQSGSMLEANALFTVTAEPGDTLLFEAHVAGPNDADAETDPSNNDDSVVVPVSSDAQADVAVEIVPLADEAGSGALFSFEVDVENISEGEESAQGVTVLIDVPQGSKFAEVESAADECSAPVPGTVGHIVCTFEELAPGDGDAIIVTVLVTAQPGAELELTASVNTASQDGDESNNEASEFVDVVPGPPTFLGWEEPDDDAGALPPPRNLEVDDAPGGRPVFSPKTTQNAVTGYRVYGSTMPGVMPMPGNLLTTVPATQTSATVPAAPAGTFFVVTATYANGESAPSNETSAQVPAATISTVKAKGAKLQMTGVNFSDEVSVFVDGIPFATPAKIKKNHTKLIQKGNLLTGQTVGAYIATHPTVFITVRNSNGGVASYTYPR